MGNGHRRRAVGNQDLLRRVNRQAATSDKKPPAKKRFAIKLSLPRRRRPSVFICPAKSSPDARPFRRVLILVHGFARDPRGAARGLWFQAHHAFWLLSDERSPCSHRPAGHLRALPIGQVRSLERDDSSSSDDFSSNRHPARCCFFEHDLRDQRSPRWSGNRHLLYRIML